MESTLIKNNLYHCIGCHYQFLAVSLVSVGKSSQEEVAAACRQPRSVLPTEQVPGFNWESRVRVREPVPGEKAWSIWPRAEAASLSGADAVRLGARPAALPPRSELLTRLRAHLWAWGLLQEPLQSRHRAAVTAGDAGCPGWWGWGPAGDEG